MEQALTGAPRVSIRYSIFRRPCSDGITTLSGLRFDRYITGTNLGKEELAFIVKKSHSFVAPDLPFWGSVEFVEFAYLGDVFFRRLPKGQTCGQKSKGFLLDYKFDSAKSLLSQKSLKTTFSFPKEECFSKTARQLRA